ncbi:MAG: glycosyltransferase [Thermoanaerobaculia bacterium]|nr:glycosyltransferase [Thermoanaerobaculia bacterium]
MTLQEPRVTVIVRTRNRPTLLAEALGSLRDQTWRDFDVVVVNDGETAPSIPADLGVPCTVIETEEPRGRARALNTGVRAARGRYVAYLDDDDLFLPDHLETLVRFLDGTDEYQAAYTDVDIVDQELGDDGRYVERSRRSGFGRDFVAGKIQFANFIPLISLAHRRSLFEKTGLFDESFDLFEDWDFMIRLAQATRPHRLGHVTALYRVRNDATNAVTAAPWQGAVAQAARRRIYEKHWQLHTPETEMAAIEGFERELAASLEWRPRAIEAEARIVDIEARRAESEAFVARQKDVIARLHSDMLALRGDSARTAQQGYERESKLHEEIAALQSQLADARREREALSESLRQAQDAGTSLQHQLDIIQGSLGWRFVTSYWRFKAWLFR